MTDFRDIRFDRPEPHIARITLGAAEADERLHDAHVRGARPGARRCIDATTAYAC